MGIRRGIYDMRHYFQAVGNKVDGYLYTVWHIDEECGDIICDIITFSDEVFMRYFGY
jgi:hypothetical protein